MVMRNIQDDIRQPAVAGQFYPENPGDLKVSLGRFLKPEIQAGQRIKALVVPHAGYDFSGAIAGRAFSCLRGQNFERVILIGPSHYISFKGLVVDEVEFYQTPLGLIPVSQLAQEFLKENVFSRLPEAFKPEHCLEVELPFLQQCLQKFEIIPMLAGNDNSLSEVKKIAQILIKHLDQKTLIVASVDFTHYGRHFGFVPFNKNIPENLKKLDDPVINYLVDFQTDKLYEYLHQTAITNDGQIVLPLLSELLKNRNFKSRITGRETSGNITGDYENSVSYASLIFYE
jgi:MEMO1 family protein